MRAEVTLPLVLAATILTGCIEHRASLAGGPSRHLVAADGERTDEGIARRGHLPQMIRASAWRRAEDGSLLRGEHVVRTPLPWWQRFPADLVSDVLVPITLSVERHEQVVLEPIAVYPADELERMARAHGYAGSAQ